MLRQTLVCHKNPVVYKYGNDRFTDQLKNLLGKNAVHKHVWEGTPLFNARALAHTNQQLDHHTYEVKYDPHREANAHFVPDQIYNKIPVPKEYKDAYWWRDLQARRLQCPTHWMGHALYNGYRRSYTDFQNLSFEKKFKYKKIQAVSHMKADLR